MPNTLITVKNLTKKFARETAVDDISLQIYDKEFLVLLGPSGCGKSTLLRLLGGFETPTVGGIEMDGRDITDLPPNKRPLNMVFQSYAVFPHMTVRDNIAYGLRIDRVAKAERETRVDEALALVQLDSLGGRFSHQLSGGQRQRVALARALVKRPRVLLLDEPLSALDAKLREAMQNELVKLQRTVGITFVVVTHDQDEALSMAKRVAVMEHGKIRQIAAPRQLYEAPQNRFVADFVGRMNILPARASGAGRCAVDGIGEISVAKSANAKSIAFVAIRPEKLSLGGMRDKGRGNDNHFVDAAVDNIAYYGGQTVLTVKTQSGIALTIAIPNSRRDTAAPAIGEKVAVSWRNEDVITLTE